MIMHKNLIVILGPTGIGKTDLSISIAEMLETVIVSADSRQIYKELRIGTAVPTDEQLNKVKHYFIGNKSIHDYYNASKYEFEANDLLRELFTKYNNILLVGGSGMYIDALCKGIDDLPEIDMELRQMLLDRFNTEGIESLRFELKKLDPTYYAQVDLRNPKRILKGLEVSIQTGKPYSSFRTQSVKARNFNILKIGLNRERDELYDRIHSRINQMLDDGLLDEVKKLLPYKNQNALNSVGYKEFFPYFEHEYSLDRAIDLMKRDTRRFAKRQFSWFNRDSDIQWFHPDNLEHIKNFIKQKIQ